MYFHREIPTDTTCHALPSSNLFLFSLISFQSVTKFYSPHSLAFFSLLKHLSVKELQYKNVKNSTNISRVLCSQPVSQHPPPNHRRVPWNQYTLWRRGKNPSQALLVRERRTYSPGSVANTLFSGSIKRNRNPCHWLILLTPLASCGLTKRISCPGSSPSQA